MKTITLYVIDQYVSIVSTYAVSNDAAGRLTRIAEFVLDDLALRSITKKTYRVSCNHLKNGEFFTPVECYNDEKVLTGQDTRFARIINEVVRDYERR